MPSPIQPLPAEVVHLIAAGEVIDSLASVVRELVENALDAGATRIAISLWPDLWRVRVADNGFGMDLADLRLAATAHSTSKIRRCDDLWKITSLGFRGEALHSLAQLSELEIASRVNISAPPAPQTGEAAPPSPQNWGAESSSPQTWGARGAESSSPQTWGARGAESSSPQTWGARGAESGWRILYDALGEPVIEEAVAIAPGTVVTVSNLFGNWQVRRQGLPSTAQQLKAVQATIQQIALCHPHVTWQVQQSDRQWFTISPGNSAHQILPQIVRDIKLSDLQLLKWEIGQGELERGKTINSPFSIPNSQYLELVLGLPDRCHRGRPDWVRVATNGRMVKSSELEQTILTSFAKTLPRDRYPVCFLHLQVPPNQIDWNRHPAKAEIYLHSMNYWQEQINQAIGQALQINSANLPEASHSERVTKLITAAENKGAYGVSRSITPTAINKQDIGLIELRAIAQIHNTYIVAEHPAGVWLVEQHIAHERVLYEQLRDAWELVPLEPPIVLCNLSDARVEQLQRINLDVEIFGEQMWAVRNAPALLTKRDDCADALMELSLGGDLQSAQVAVACRSAIRNGTPLNLSQMQTILEQWQRTRHPRTCPHGRPIYLSLEETALAKFFRRHWVIGKSHGI